MASVLSVEMLPALNGDCIWIEYGAPGALRRLLIDGGPLGAYCALEERILRLPPAERRFELVVVTHVDIDHIDGIVRLLGRPELGVQVDDLWFNGWPQISKQLPQKPPPPESLDSMRGPVQGEYLAVRVAERKLGWNRWFAGRAIHVPVPGARAALPSVTLEGDLRVTVLGPTPKRLEKLRTAWDKAVRKAGFDAGDDVAAAEKLAAAKRYRGAEAPLPSTDWADLPLVQSGLDDAVANGSSIALLLEYQGRRCALLGDAFAPDCEASLRQLAAERGEPRLRLDALKVSHHGSRNNTTPALLDAVDCPRFLVSTDGSHGFGHPDEEAMRCIVQGAGRPPQLIFNYECATTRPYADPALQRGRFTSDYARGAPVLL
jgi:hypothetical protein